MTQVLTAWLAMAPPPEGQAGNPFSMFAPMIIIFAIFYFMLIRPQQRKEKERRQMIDNVKAGERIMFCGGLIGTIMSVKEGTFTVKVAEGVKLEVARGAVNRVIGKDEKLDVETNA